MIPQYKLKNIFYLPAEHFHNKYCTTVAAGSNVMIHIYMLFRTSFHFIQFVVYEFCRLSLLPSTGLEPATVASC